MGPSDKPTRTRTAAGYLLQQALRRSGMTAREAALRSGISEGRISDYISGRHDPSVGQLFRVLRAMNCTIEVVRVEPACDDNGLELERLLDLADAISVGAAERKFDDRLPSFLELVRGVDTQ